MINQPPNDIAYTLQQSINLGIAHKEIIEVAGDAMSHWKDFLFELEKHKDYCADVGEEPQESE